MPFFFPVVMEYNIVVLNGTVQKFKSWSKLVDWWFVFKNQLIICFAVLEHYTEPFCGVSYKCYWLHMKELTCNGKR